MDAIFYLVDNGVKWRAMLADLPPWSTVYNFFAGWPPAGVILDLLDTLRQRVQARRRPYRHADSCDHPTLAESQGQRFAEFARFLPPSRLMRLSVAVDSPWDWP